DGSDVWPVLAASLVPSPAADGGVQYDADKPKYVDKAAFVANGALVANLPEGAFWFTAQVSIEVVAAVFTAKVEKLGSGAWTLKNGMLSGLTKVSSVLGTLPWVNDPFSDKPICTDNVIYSGIKGMICSYPDMSLLGLPSKPCDHLSMGVAVEGVPAKLGPISVKVKAPSPCTPATDPTTDGC
ncbi:MAG: hypothetical protein IT377_01040, partial [Polyangiaceae bacterium]|nr:hypothetical protein [Polyangiaceae bacterium]